MIGDNTMQFPKDFIFGVATSAGQVEGGAFDDGRGMSIWDKFAATPGKTHNGQLPSIACDSYHRFDEDLDNLKKLGVDSYRMSISWSRVLPDGVGALNQKGVDYYKRCFNALLEAGIMPNVTLYHWDLPQSLEDRGGWKSRDSIEWFAEYAEKMFAQYGDIVPMWSTINEPIATYVGYAHGGFAPGYTNEQWGNIARHNILVAHGAAVKAFRASHSIGKIGVVIDIWKRHALTDSPEDIALAAEEDENNWKFYTDPIFAGRYSDFILNKMQSEGTMPDIRDGDLALTSCPIDYYGLNVYNRVTVTKNEKAAMDFSQGGNFLNNHAEYYPKAVYDAIHLMHDLYDLKIPIYITENGTYHIGEEEFDKEAGMICDEDRIKYCRGFLEWTKKAIDEGFDVRGYYLWSLMDNFEWSAAYNYKFGIIHTDFQTLEKTWKKSAYWYRDLIRNSKGK